MDKTTHTKLTGLWMILVIALFTTCQNAPENKVNKPNVLFIAVDDLNDWVGSMGGHPQASTPNIDRLASKGMLFTNAHCQSPVCNPSRASLMSSLYPSTTGLYFLSPHLKNSPEIMESTLMPDRFEKEGYQVLGAGKLFHNGGEQNETYIPNYAGQFGGFGPLPEKKLTGFVGNRLWDWGAFPASDSLMPDYKIANWAMEKLKEDYDSSFWMGVGFYRPHVPQYAPKKWFDMYPLESVQLPATIPNDMEDISAYGSDITRLEHIAPTHKWVLENDEWKPLVQSYLACVSFVDNQVGKVLSALEQGKYGDNTYIVLFSDHGFHLGEKERYAKRSLWGDGTRVPLIIVGPGIALGKTCNKPVELLDIYPTLLELTGLESDPAHEGHSLVPLLKDSEAAWPHFARASFGPGNHAIVSERYRFIQYVDGSEEFYDHSIDPHEWNNVAGDPQYSNIIDEHRNQLPQNHHEILEGNSTGHHSYKASGDKLPLKQQ